ncbi:VCBS repeat-containing protein, partial [candidate division WOR-3 bacterium]|nr:VCBS repeat-containing protein [candidate division WOR-3 bacterium]
MVALSIVLVLIGQPVRWVETTHADFADGIIDPQMYVSLRGQLEPDSGCVEFFSRFDVNNDGWYDLGCSDDSGPNLTIYLGSPAGYFPESRLRYGPLGSGGNIDLADLNLDGHAELIHSGWRDGRAAIYWGTPSGPSPFDTTVLDYDGEGEDVSVYDLDKDAYLDILVGSSNGRLYIFWGSKDGYLTSNRSAVNLGRSLGHNIEVADLDRDGWGDIVLSSWTWGENPIVYWGPNRQPRTIIWLPGRWNNFHGISVADLDKNGWLDIVYTGYDTVVTSYIYFGTDSGFSVNNRTEVHPGQCYGGSAVVDLNDDSWLDIVFLRGNWIHGGTWKPVVYYNTLRAPCFSDSNRVDLGTGTFNASGGFIGDFDRDDIPDIFVNNMIARDSSFILWGPDYMRRTGLPSHLDHHGVFREPGNVYDRSLTAYYRSSVFDAGDTARCMSGACRWLAFEPPGSKVLVACRSGDAPVPDSTWTEFDWADSMTGRIPDHCLGGRYL